MLVSVLHFLHVLAPLTVINVANDPSFPDHLQVVVGFMDWIGSCIIRMSVYHC